MASPGLQPDTGAARGRLRSLLIALAALTPVVPIVIGVLLFSSTDTHPAAGSTIRPLPTIPASGFAPLVKKIVHHPQGATVALVTRATTLKSAPGGPALAPQPLKTTFGSSTVLLVRRSVGRWLGVVTPLAGNGHLGWISRSDVSLSRVHWQINVSLTRRELMVYDNRKLQEIYRIAIGRPTAPTPTGEFAVTDRLQTGDPDGPYGCCIIALSAVAPHAIQGWGGGNRIAIHSTPDTSTIGDAISHGCMHVTLPEGQWMIKHVPLGTPVIVRT